MKSLVCLIFIFLFAYTLQAKDAVNELTVKKLTVKPDYSVDIVAEGKYTCKRYTLNLKQTNNEEAAKHIVPMAFIGWDCISTKAIYTIKFSDPDIRDNVYDFVIKVQGEWIIKIDDVEATFKL